MRPLTGSSTERMPIRWPSECRSGTNSASSGMPAVGRRSCGHRRDVRARRVRLPVELAVRHVVGAAAREALVEQRLPHLASARVAHQAARGLVAPVHGRHLEVVPGGAVEVHARRWRTRATPRSTWRSTRAGRRAPPPTARRGSLRGTRAAARALRDREGSLPWSSNHATKWMWRAGALGFVHRCVRFAQQPLGVGQPASPTITPKLARSGVPARSPVASRSSAMRSMTARASAADVSGRSSANSSPPIR